MAGRRTSRRKIGKIQHICMVVRDIDKALKCYEDVYGIGPWILGGTDDFKYLPGTTYVHGKQVDVKARIALCYALNVPLELIQPLDETSPYAEFLREHGEGVHHLMVESGDTKGYLKLAKSRGSKEVFRGYASGKPFTQKLGCIYHDLRKDLGFISEIAPKPLEPIDNARSKRVARKR